MAGIPRLRMYNATSLRLTGTRDIGTLRLPTVARIPRPPLLTRSPTFAQLNQYRFFSQGTRIAPQQAPAFSADEGEASLRQADLLAFRMRHGNATVEQVADVLRHIMTVMRSQAGPGTLIEALELLDHFLRNPRADRSALRDILFTALKHSDGGVVWKAVRSSQEAGPLIQVSEFTANAFSWVDPPHIPQQNPNRVLGGPEISPGSWFAFHSLLEALDVRYSSTTGTPMPLSSVQPAHSPEYDWPGISVARRDEALVRAEKQLELLKTLVHEAGDNPNPVAVITRFFHEATKTHSKIPVALELESGRLLLIDGHHRRAVLHTAVRRGLMPAHWLETVPIALAGISCIAPTALVLRLMAFGRTLSTEMPTETHFR